jgi:Mlc titration factor MtfA (ptsG expression regulator)
MVMILFFAVIVLVAGFFLLRKKKQSDIDIRPILVNYKAILLKEVEFYQRLDDTDKNKFEALVHEFLNDVKIEGVGTSITDLDKVLIASSAIIPVFGFPEWKYKNLTNIILYPNTFDKDFQFEGENRSILGMVGSGYMNGQMILSRKALMKGFSKESGKENTAIHEFVHLLDKSDGIIDGIPEIFLDHEYAVPWLKMMHQEMHRIEAGKSDINPYALTNEAEFLAVASEYFFEKPEKFQHTHPELYAMLSKIFQQDPEGSKVD